MKTTHAITTLVRYAVLALFITVVITLLAARFAVPGGFRLYSVLSGSMEPAIPVGALVITGTPKDASDIATGDIITFTQTGSEQTITHRVASITEESGRVRFTTRGDANDRDDIRPVLLQDIQGVYKVHIPALGRMLEYLKTPLGVSIFILAPLLFLIADELRKGFRNISTRQDQQPLTAEAATFPLKTLGTTTPLVDSIIHQKNLPKTQRQYKVKVTALGVYIALAVGLTGVAATHALFTSNTVSLRGNTLATAAVFPTPTLTPTPTPSPEATPEPDTCENADVTINASNENSGPGSVNENSVHVSTECNIDSNTETETSTTVTVDADTGNNSQNNNTAEGDQSSGDVTVTIGIQNSN